MRFHTTPKLWLLSLVSCLMLCACSGIPADAPKQTHENRPDVSEGSDQPDTENAAKGSRDNTPRVLLPSADGEDAASCDSAAVNTTHAAEGYIMASYTGSNSKPMLQLRGPDQVTYTYYLHGGYEVFPLTAGDGAYTVEIYENIRDTDYAVILTCDITVALTRKFGPYLYPNQYVDFDEDSLPVAKAADLAAFADTDLEVVSNVYNYIISNFSYNYDKAASVSSGYLPVVDEVYSANTGICFDYAAVMAAMLRSQAIPTRLEVGYMGEVYHAWISTYIEEIGWINGIIEFDGKEWRLMDPTYASTSSSPQSFLTENDKYLTKYVY